MDCYLWYFIIRSTVAAREVITRNCLSSLEYSRHDIPADKYEGCRPASKDIVLGHYVHYQLIKELDIKRFTYSADCPNIEIIRHWLYILIIILQFYRDYYDEVTFCFCEFDHWCNSAMNLLPNYFTFWISCSFLFVYTFGFFM